MKYFLLALIIFVSFYIATNNLFAQDANIQCPTGFDHDYNGDGVITDEDVPGAEITNITPNSDIVNWAKLINERLENGSVWDGYKNRMVKVLSNGTYKTPYREGLDTGTSKTGLFWCTNTVISSFNLAGITGLGPQQQGVIGMRSWWKENPPGHIYVEYTGAQNKLSALKNVKPGCAFFIERSPGIHDRQHTGIVSEISVNDKGNGFLKTYESNTPGFSYTYPIAKAIVKNFAYPLQGFGCASN
jgi:hypothetical protein